jgi:hypothetical protein
MFFQKNFTLWQFLMVTKSSLVTLFLALCLVLISAGTLEFSERTHHPVRPAIDPPLEPIIEPFVDLSIEPSYDPPPLDEPVTVAKRHEDGDRPEIQKEEGTPRLIHPRTKPKIDFLKSLRKAGPKFSQPIHKVISASLACQTKWKSPLGEDSRITEDKPDESSEPIHKVIIASPASQTGWRPSLAGVSGITGDKPLESEKSFTNSFAYVNPEPEGERGLTKFELLRSKMVKAEVFMFFRLSFGPKGEFAIEMNLDPTTEKGIGVSFPTDTIRLPSGSTPSVSQTIGPSLF